MENDAEELEREKTRMIAKASLRRLAASHGQSYVIECVTGGPNSLKATQQEKEEIRKNFRVALELDTLEGVDINQLI